MKASELRAMLDDATAEERAAFFDALTVQQSLELKHDWPFWARPEQLLPDGDAWYLWKVLAGRGFGKTRTGAEAVVEWARQPGTRIALIGRIPQDVRRVMVEGESGILACSPPWFYPEWNSAIGELRWPNGSLGQCFSSEVPSNLRGPQFHKAWIDEWCKFRWPEEVWDMLMMCLRLGKTPQVISTTTPRPSKLLRELLSASTTRVTKGSTFDNAGNLPEMYLRQLLDRFAGTNLGAQELYAMILDKVEGALWDHDTIEKFRLKARRLDDGTYEFPTAPPLKKTVLAIDPGVSDDIKEEAAETGIVLAGLGADGHGYVLKDLSGRGGLHLHAGRILEAWRAEDVDEIVVEKNQGGALVAHTLRMTTDPKTGKPAGPRLPIKEVTATKGKRTRAEPVSMLYQQGKVHHLGKVADLEDQMCTWIPDVSKKSPDRMDALVWAFTHLIVQPRPGYRARII